MSDVLFKGDDNSNGKHRCWFFKNLECLYCGKKSSEGRLSTPICKRHK